MEMKDQTKYTLRDPNLNDTLLRFPRTMEQAFPRDRSNQSGPKKMKSGLAHRVVAIAMGLALVVVLWSVKYQ